jgi:glycosyltransferase involved in cell wall biosynthesis
MLKVLAIGSGWYPEAPGGAENVFYQLMRHLPGQGLSIRGLTPGEPEVNSALGGSVQAFARTTSSLRERLLSARAAVSEELGSSNQPDLIASHFALYALPSIDALARRPMVVHFHGPWALESGLEGAGRFAVLLKQSVERLVYSQAQRIIVLSRAFADVLIRSYGMPAKRIRIVPGGVDCARFAPTLTKQEACAALGWPQDRPTIFTVRRLVRRMGLSTLLLAMKDVRASCPDARLVIAGRGPERERLEREIDDLSLRGSVELSGYMPEERLPLAYRAAAFTVMPSVGLEGFGLVAAESLASGTPVFVTPVGGLPDVVNALSRGLVLSGTDAGAIADRLKAALAGTIALPSSEACRIYAQSHFDWPIIASGVNHVYVDALQ